MKQRQRRTFLTLNMSVAKVVEAVETFKEAVALIPKGKTC